MVVSFFKKILIACFLFVVALNSALSQTKKEPKYHGLLWEITGANLKKPSYLYGTMHVSNKVAFHLSDSFFVSIKNCDKVALEINPDSFFYEIFNTDLLTELQESKGTSYNSFIKKAFIVNAVDDKTIQSILSRDHHFANYLLYRSQHGLENFEEDTYLDLFIFQAGKKLNKGIVGLESVELTLKLDMKAKVESTYEEEGERYSYDYDNYTDTEDMLQEAYRKGDLDKIDSLTHLSHSKKYIEYMINYRNKLMAEKMDSIIRTGPLFTGVGAAHLPGDEGIINLLRKKGYTLRAVTYTEKESRSVKDKIDKKIYKQEKHIQTMEDSLFEVTVPGSMLTMPHIDDYRGNAASYKEYFFPDMVNGAYYSISRFSTFTPLYGNNNVQKNTEDMLYENIPGKILKKKKSYLNNIPVIDVVSRTRRGDIQQHKILFTPLELIVFKLSGTKGFMDQEADKFFSSIKIRTKDSDKWKTFSPLSGGFSINLPENRIIEDNNKALFADEKEYIIQSLAGKNYYLFIKSNYFNMAFLEEDSFELGFITRKFYQKLKYDLLEEKKGKTADGISFKELHLKNGNDSITLKALLDGESYYLLAYKGTDETSGEKFLNSFSKTPVKYGQPFEVYTDTALYFKVNTCVTPNNKFQELINMMPAGNKKKKDLSDQNFKSLFHSAPTSEEIVVNYYKFNEYREFENYEKFWKWAYARMNDFESMVITDKKIISDNERILLLSDTNTNRAIKIRMILKNGIYYYLKTVLPDKNKDETAFVKNFFTTFTPLDSNKTSSVIGKGKSAEKFFRVIQSKDTAEVEYALSSLDEIDFGNKHTDKIIQLIENHLAIVSPLKEYQRKLLLEKLAKSDAPAVKAFLENKYAAYTDSSSLQLGILTGLALKKTKSSYKQIVQLLKSDTPLNPEDEISTLFFTLKDSLQLCVNLFPELMSLSTYPEYKYDIYNILATLTDSGIMIKPQVYQPWKDQILKDAGEEIKRQLSQENSSSDVNTSDYDYQVYSKSLSSTLYNEAIILLPYYDEAGVKSFYTRLRKTKDKYTLLNIFILLLQHNKPIEDTVWNYYSSTSNPYRIDLYELLKKAGHLEKFGNKSLSQEEIAKNELFESSDIRKDSVFLISKKQIKIKGGEATMYLFKRKKKNHKSWELDCISFAAKDTSTLVFDPLVTRKGLKYSDENMKELSEKLTDDVILTSRTSRYNSNWQYNLDYYYEYDEE